MAITRRYPATKALVNDLVVNVTGSHRRILSPASLPHRVVGKPHNLELALNAHTCPGQSLKCSAPPSVGRGGVLLVWAGRDTAGKTPSGAKQQLWGLFARGPGQVTPAFLTQDSPGNASNSTIYSVTLSWRPVSSPPCSPAHPPNLVPAPHQGLPGLCGWSDSL